MTLTRDIHTGPMILLGTHGEQAGEIAFRQGFWHSGVDNPRAVLRVVHAADTWLHPALDCTKSRPATGAYVA